MAAIGRVARPMGSTSFPQKNAILAYKTQILTFKALTFCTVQCTVYSMLKIGIKLMSLISGQGRSDIRMDATNLRMFPSFVPLPGLLLRSKPLPLLDVSESLQRTSGGR